MTGLLKSDLLKHIRPPANLANEVVNQHVRTYATEAVDALYAVVRAKAETTSCYGARDSMTPVPYTEEATLPTVVAHMINLIGPVEVATTARRTVFVPYIRVQENGRTEVPNARYNTDDAITCETILNTSHQFTTSKTDANLLTSSHWRTAMPFPDSTGYGTCLYQLVGEAQIEPFDLVGALFFRNALHPGNIVNQDVIAQIVFGATSVPTAQHFRAYVDANRKARSSTEHYVISDPVPTTPTPIINLPC